jgi:hypothetical protein
MTVTYKGEIPTERKGRNDLGTRTYTRKFKLETDSTSDGVFEVGSHSSLPRIGDIYPGDLFAYCISLDVECTEGYRAWVATASYTTERTRDDPSNQGDPADDDPVISWSSEIYQEPVYKTTSDTAILNSAGDYFIDPSPTRDAAHLIAKIRQNVSSVPSWVLSYQNAVNDGAITIGGLSIAASLAKVQRIDIGEVQYRGEYAYYPLSLEIHIHKDGWKLKPLDAGFRERNGANELVMITNNGDDEEVTQPVPLDGAGGVLANPTPANAVFGEFTIYEELDFTSLPGVS